MIKVKYPGAKTSGEIDLGRNVLIHHDMVYIFAVVHSSWIDSHMLPQPHNGKKTTNKQTNKKKKKKKKNTHTQPRRLKMKSMKHRLGMGSGGGA